jgi:hemerythrin-like metal-binding protein
MEYKKYNLWKPDYAVEVDEIDSQHKKFFEYCTRLIQLADESHVSNSLNADLIHLFFKLRAYGFRHFMDEEALMLKYAYPPMIEHTREHNRYYIEIFTHIESDYNIYNLDITAVMDDASRRIARFVSDFAADWLGRHIYARDKLLGEYICNKRKGRN